MVAKKSISRICSLLFVMVLMLAAAPLKAAQAAGVRYATPDGTGNCSSWENACSLQSALTGASSGDEIWAAAGTYKPTTGADRSATFQLKDGVALYGGFTGTETVRTQRDPAAHVTILSGDLNSDDAGFANNTENSYHVVTGASGATLDGFTVTAGNANGGQMSATGYGGGMTNSYSNPTLTNVIFSGNSANYGGGMVNGGSSPVLTNVTFSGNSVDQLGGGMFSDSSSPTLMNVTFNGNSAFQGGGIFNNPGGNSTLTNVTFSGNSAPGGGGGMFNYGNATLTNATFNGNSAGVGGGIYVFQSYGNTHIRNSIFWGNTAGDGAQIGNDRWGGPPIMSDSVVQDGYTGTNIISADPHLGMLGNYGGFTQTIPLRSGSSAIDAGNNATCASTDQRGVARVNACDIGAFEYTGIDYVGVRHAKPTASGTGDCSSWANACSLQSALTGASSGDEIWAAAGTYKPTTGADRSATFQLKDGVALYGGFAGTETERDQRDPAAHVTILSGDLNSDDVGFTNNSENSYHAVTGASGATLDGFTITAGNANGNDSCPDIGCGGGMLNDGGNLTLTNVTFSGNAAHYGGGMVNWGGSPTLANVTFSGNAASVDGGGMYNVNDSNPTLTNVTFSSNSAGNEGGGMHNRGLHSTITNATFSGNSANKGGAMYNSGSTPWMVNITFSGNSAVDHGGGMYIDDYSHPSFRDTIFWGNTAAGGIGGQIYANSGGADAYNSLVQGGCADGSWTCDTNILTADPMIGTLGDYGGFTQTISLQAGSSAIDAGNDLTCAITDQRGITRPQGLHCDIGAYEVVVGTLGNLKAVPGGLTSGLCESWADACELRYALTSALSGQEIWAAAGTYKPTAGADRSLTFQLKSAVALYGGFAGTETGRAQRDPAAHLTILSGDLNGDDAGFANNSENSYHVVTSTSDTTLDGFTITAGNANGSSPNDSGGGVYNNLSSSLILINVIFSGNTASSSGGGMFNNSSSPTLANITFSGNTTAGNGGGMYNSYSSPALTNITFSSNSADKGGALYNSVSSPVMTNVTFSGNSAIDHGGGMFIADLSYPQFRNTIFWGNTAAGGIGGQIYNFSGNTTSSDSVVQGGCADNSWSCGSNIITADPHLGMLGNYGGFTQTIPLRSGSSAIDAGNNATCASTDQRGVARVNACDIGAFEYTGIDYVGVRHAKPAASGTGDCSSWANACTLQIALTGASSGDEIWVEAGTYKPTTGADRTATFQLKNGVAVYGGFAGTETARTQRNPAAHVTILSGDIDGNDSQTPVITDLTTVTHNDTNSYHVVTGATGATLDGFTITAGYAYEGDSQATGCGGGMLNSSSSPTLTSIIFSGNLATYGGGMYNSSSSPTLTDVTFSHNAANPLNSGGGIYNITSSPALTNVTFSNNSAGYGGGMFDHSSSNPTLTNVTFSNNTVAHDGGGLFNQVSSSPTLTNVTFSGNTAPAGNGGGMFNYTNSPHISNTLFSGNSADYGGGMYNSSSNPTLTDVTFSGNAADPGYSGGGIYNLSSSPALTNVTFSNNSAGYGGGMFDHSSSNPTLTNVTFSSNTVSHDGGGLFSQVSSSPTLTNVTFSGNTAPGNGGGMYNYSNSPQIRNTLFWGNTAAGSGAQIYNDSGGNPSLNDSVVQDGCPAGSTCTNILTADPKLGALGDYGGFTQTIPLRSGSSAIDAGNDLTCASTDQRGVARVNACDIGAFEYTGIDYVSVRYAKPTASGAGDCSSWANACTLQTALTGATFGQEIWAAAGSYKPTTGADRSLTFQLKNGVAVYGGFAGTETARAQRNPATHVTILSGDIDGNDSQTPVITDITTVTHNDTNSYHVVTGVTGATLDGFTITAGNANGSVSCPGTNCGGGMYNSYSSPTLTSITFSGNSATYGGGGMFNWYSNPTLMNDTFSSNFGGLNGGGMENNYSSPTLTNVTFDNNSATTYAGGMANTFSSPILTNVTFSDNSATTNGGGMVNWGSNSLLRNTIFWGNAAPNGAQIWDYSSTPSVSDSVVQGGYTGTNILTADPKLGALGNYGGFTQTIPLLFGSSAIDAGNDTVCPATDQRGVTRPQGAHCDIGAFEYVDIIPPTVVSSVRLNASPTNLSSVGFTVTFSEPVTGVDSNDFALNITGLTGTSITNVSGGPTSYAVTVNTGSGDGTLRLDLKASGTGIQDLATNPISGGFTGGEAYSIDKTVPTVVSSVRLNASPTNLTNVGFTVTFSEPVTGVDSNDFALTKTGGISGESVSGVSGGPTIYTVSVNNGAGDGTLRLDLKASGTGIQDLATNPISGGFTGGDAYNIDKTAPDTQINTYPANPSNSASAEFTFSSPDSTATFQCSLEGGAFAACTSPKNFTGLTNGSHTFAVRAKDPAGNVDATPASFTWTIDTIVPTVTSSVRLNPSPTNLASVKFTVTFSESVTGVDKTDFSLTASGVTGASVTTVSGAGATRTVTVNTGTGNGTLRLDVPASATITDLAGNHLVVPYTSGASYVIDKTAPTVVSSVRADPNPTTASSVHFTLTFSESVTGVDKYDLSLTASGITGAYITTVNGSGATRTVTVKTGSGHGTLRLNVVDNDSIRDSAGNPLGGKGTGNGNYFSGQKYTIDRDNQFLSTGSQDGWVLESAMGKGVGGSLDYTGHTFQLGDDASNRQYRAILSFNTGSLPDNATILSAVLKIKQSGLPTGTTPFGNLGSLYADIRTGFFGSSNSLELADFNATATASKVGTFGSTPVSGWYSVTLNSSVISNINKVSLTQFRLYFSKATNLNTKADFMKFYSGDASSYQPQLIITYTLP